MRVLIFLNRIANKGGSEKASINLANMLAENGYSVTLLTWMGGVTSFYPVYPAVKVDALFEKDVNIYTGYLSTLVRYHKKLNQYNPEVVIDVTTALSLFSVPLKSFHRYKLISWEHFNSLHNWNAITPRISRYLAARYAHVVTLTHTDKENFRKIYKARNVSVIHNTVTIQTQAKVNMSNRQVLAVGRLEHQKGYDLLLHAWVKVQETCKDWKLKIVGDGAQRESLLALVQQLNLGSTVSVLPSTNEIEKHYAESSIFVMSSRFEGLPLVLIEAKSMALPIVSFNCITGPADVIRHNIDGLLVAPENTAALSDALIVLMKDEKLRKQFSDATQEDIGRFGQETNFNNWVKVIHAV